MLGNRNLQLPVVDGKLIWRWQGAGFTQYFDLSPIREMRSAHGFVGLQGVAVIFIWPAGFFLVQV